VVLVVVGMDNFCRDSISLIKKMEEVSWYLQHVKINAQAPVTGGSIMGACDLNTSIPNPWEFEDH
jgi:hypothetical protein